MWQTIISLIEQNTHFIITSHHNPDCDALGSELALAEHLANLGKKVTIINSDPTPDAFRFLDPQRTIKKYSPAKHADLIKEAQVIVVVDASGEWKRVGRVGEALAQAGAVKACIDHHPDSTDFVDMALVDTDAAATAELIYELVVAMHGSISEQMAQALYAAIVTDTGSFRFPKTGPRTHQITAEVLRAGAQPYQIYRQLYEQYSLARVRLKGHVIDSIKTAAQGQIAYYGLDQQTLNAYGVKTSELDTFASLGQEISGVRVVVFCLQSSKSKVKISLRSDDSVEINHLAVSYGGGGHTSAAGAMVTGRLDDVMAEVVEKVKRLLEAEPKS
ncbi:MAG: bifunctional oligoribonuclease/PAP phosphatase NrnA [Chloroflexi bacterium]|nr:bifunctional oligoribonuclease/PAP phosphatase NrnA [Chloroflexota bacterium]